MKRWHVEFPRLTKQAARSDRVYGTLPQLGRFRKRHANDCGKAHCGVCHGDKFPKRIPTKQEVIAALSDREQRGTS